MHEIKKSFEFDYGHRVWSQNLNKDLSVDDKLVCRHLHGHRGVVEIFLTSDNLRHGMVTDFKHLNWLKVALDCIADHKFIIDMNDPQFERIVGTAFDKLEIQNNHIQIGDKSYYTKTSSIVPPPDAIESAREILEGFTICYFVPTSENLAMWLFKVVNEIMVDNVPGVKVSKVIWRETPKTYAEYSI